MTADKIKAMATLIFPSTDELTWFSPVLLRHKPSGKLTYVVQVRENGHRDDGLVRTSGQTPEWCRVDEFEKVSE